MAQNVSSKKWRGRLRFSLRTAMLGLMLVNALALLALHWNPWRQTYTLGTGDDVGEAITFFPDGVRVLTSGPRGTVIWSIESGRELMRWDYDHQVFNRSLSPDGTKIILRHHGYKCIFSTSDGTELQVLYSPKSTPAFFSADGDFVAVKDTIADRFLIWNVETGEKIYAPKLDDPYDCGIYCMETKQGFIILTVAEDSLEKLAAHNSLGQIVKTIELDPADKQHFWDVYEILWKLKGDPLSKIRSRTWSPYSGWEDHDARKWVWSENGDFRCLNRWKDIQIWKRFRPEAWWGVIALPEFCLAVLATIATAWSFRRDRISPRPAPLS